MVEFNDITRYYEYFYKKTKKSEKYKFIPSQKATKTINKFLDILEDRYKLKTISDNFLWKYFNFQFKYWEELTIEAFWGKMQIDYIIGEKAFSRYIERNKEFDFTLESENNELVKKYEMNINDLIKKQNKKSLYKKNNTHIKKKFYNTDRGFDTCIQFTTLFDPRDSVCLVCNYKVQCKELLRVNYPKIYKLRNDNK